MGRKKSTDTPEVKSLRKLMMSLGLSVKAVSDLIMQTEGRHAELSAKACDVELYIAAHPEVKNPGAYAARTLKNFVSGLQHEQADSVTEHSVVGESRPVMELWGEDDFITS